MRKPTWVCDEEGLICSACGKDICHCQCQESVPLRSDSDNDPITGFGAKIDSRVLKANCRGHSNSGQA